MKANHVNWVVLGLALFTEQCCLAQTPPGVQSAANSIPPQSYVDQPVSTSWQYPNRQEPPPGEPGRGLQSIGRSDKETPWIWPEPPERWTVLGTEVRAPGLKGMSAPGGGADEMRPQPIPRTDRNSQIAHQQLLEKARKGGIDVYFIGDSITRRWGATDYPELLANWNTNFHGWNAANFGWGADRIENMLWRMKNGELDGVNPKIIVVLAGINNVGASPGDEAKVENITRGLKALMNICRQKAPDATLILTALFPRNDNMAVIPTINQINLHLAQMADGNKIRFLNVNDKLADKDGRLFEGMSRDRLHPTVKGYQVWADGLKPIFTEILGPPAQTDHAPPPTGDPSAKPRQAASQN